TNKFVRSRKPLTKEPDDLSGKRPTKTKVPGVMAFTGADVDATPLTYAGSGFGRLSGLLVHYFDLLIDRLTGETINRHVHPVTLLAIYDETICQACSIRRKAATLRDHID